MGEVFGDFAPAFDPAFASLSPGERSSEEINSKQGRRKASVFDFSKGKQIINAWCQMTKQAIICSALDLTWNLSGYAIIKTLVAITGDIQAREKGTTTL